jgi:hypothetical protein
MPKVSSVVSSPQIKISPLCIKKQNATGSSHQVRDLKQEGYGNLGPMFGCVTLCGLCIYMEKKSILGQTKNYENSFKYFTS